MHHLLNSLVSRLKSVLYVAVHFKCSYRPALSYKVKRGLVTSNFFNSSLATVYSTPEELGTAAVFSEEASHSSKRAKSSRNFCHRRHVSSILKNYNMLRGTARAEWNNNCRLFLSVVIYMSLLSMDRAQIVLQRRSRLRVACWMESHSASVAQASQSCRSTSHKFSTDATPVLCFSMSRWSSCKQAEGENVQ